MLRFAILCSALLLLSGAHGLSTSKFGSKVRFQPLRIRGGGGPILSTHGMFDTGTAAIGLQSALMTTMPRETFKLFGVPDDRISQRTESFAELWGNSLLIEAALIYFALRSHSLPKALALANLLHCLLAMRYALKRCDSIGQPKEHILTWALFAALVACLGLTDGLGFLDGDMIVKIYAGFTGLHALAGIIMPKTMANAYAPALAFGAAWLVFVVQCLHSVFMQDWRNLELPNGLAPALLALANAGYVYNAIKLVQSTPTTRGPGSSSVRDL